MRFIFITGGVTSSLGKGIVSSSLGALLEARKYKVRLKKMDPYLNVDPGTMSPFQHGEVFVTEDGAETDLDLGHYERFTTNICNKNDSISAGKIYYNVIEKERNGDYLGDTIQVIPHVTNEIKLYVENDLNDEDFVICEIGGTVGDIESTPFLESLRQFINEKGKKNVLVIHLTLLPYLEAADEIKTKPTQHSVRELQSLGIKPDILLCRCNRTITESAIKKIALFCNVEAKDVIPGYNLDCIYQAPLAYHKEGLDDRVLEYFKGHNLLETSKEENKSLADHTFNASQWQDIENKINNYQSEVTIAFVGKYVIFRDAYKSLVEALNHGGIYNFLKVNIKWVDSEILEEKNCNLNDVFKNVDGILVGPGFGERGIEGKIKAITYIKEQNIPFLGICLGMQMVVIETARNALGLKDANSSEFSKTGVSVIALVSEWVKDGVVEKRSETSKKGGTMRLGSYPCKLLDNSLVKNIYNNADVIHERHRHRYEVNINYKKQLEEAGLVFSGQSPDGLLMEIVELPAYRWFVGVQFHPELKSKIFNPHPLFQTYIKACYEYKKIK
ncbi:CTP synthase [Candidatus Hepatincolaceae symbiont of Richtersius coronifer]